MAALIAACIVSSEFNGLVASVIGEADGNIENIKMTNRVADYTEMLIDLEVWDLQHLNEILAGLRAKDVVSSAVRAED